MKKEHTDEQISEFSKILSEERESFANLASELTPQQLRAAIESLIEFSGVPVRKLPEKERRRNSGDFHRLWTASLSSPQYNKKSWLEIEKQLLAAGVIGFDLPAKDTPLSSSVSPQDQPSNNIAGKKKTITQEASTTE